MTEFILTIEQVIRTISEAIDAGIERYAASRDPYGGRMKRADALRYVKRNGLEAKVLREWERDGKLKPVKPQKRKNCAIWYAFADVKALVLSAKLYQRTGRREEPVGDTLTPEQ